MTKGWDHDPPAKEKLVPFGILMRATGALMLLFGHARPATPGSMRCSCGGCRFGQASGTSSAW